MSEKTPSPPQKRTRTLTDLGSWTCASDSCLPPAVLHWDTRGQQRLARRNPWASGLDLEWRWAKPSARKHWGDVSHHPAVAATPSLCPPSYWLWDQIYTKPHGLHQIRCMWLEVSPTAGGGFSFLEMYVSISLSVDV